MNERGPAKQRVPRPDAYFVLCRGGKRAAFFLELDRGSMPRAALARKIRVHLDYWRSGRYEADYGSRSLRVLTVAGTRGRLEHLIEWTVKEGGAELFWFALQEEVTAERVLTAPIWRVAGWTGVHALMAIANDHPNALAH